MLQACSGFSPPSLSILFSSALTLPQASPHLRSFLSSSLLWPSQQEAAGEVKGRWASRASICTHRGLSGGREGPVDDFLFMRIARTPRAVPQTALPAAPLV